MIRSVASKVAWVGRTASMVFGLALVLALVVGVASAAFGANGQAWILGRSNVATAITSLGGKQGVNGPMVRITNKNAGTDDTALQLRVQAGEPPMTVNRDTKVANLNSDQLDGKDESAFLGKTEKAADSDKLDGKDSSGYVQTDTNKFIRNNMFEYTSDLSTGTLRTSDGTYSIDMPCPSSLKTNPNYSPRLLSGGFRDIDNGTAVLESYPTFTAQGETWRVRIKNNNTLDEFRVVVKCTDQRP